MSLVVPRRAVLRGTAALAGAVALHPFAARAASDQAHLRVLETTDLHVNVFPYDYYADKPNDTFGLTRTASLVDAVRAEAGNTLLIDNGDIIQGSPMGDDVAFAHGLPDGYVHPIIRAMNTMGYSCSTLGNHEFNYGLDFLDRAIAGANFPFVCANLARGALAADPLKDRTYVAPYVILDRTVKDGAGRDLPIRIGLIGFVPPQIMTWDAQHLDGRVATRDIVEAARAWVPRMREAGADLVIALSHSGIAGGGPADRMENASLYLAGVPGIDAILTGHQHLVFPGPKDFGGIAGVDTVRGTLQGVPAVMAGFWGSHMGLIDLALEHGGGRWRVADFTSEVRPIFRRDGKAVVPLVADDAAVAAAAKPDHDATLAYVRTPVGRTSAPLFSYFALVADDPSVQIVSDAQLWYAAPLLAATRWGGLPLLSAAAPFKVGGRNGADYYTDIPAGPIAIRNVADLYLYPNTVTVVAVTGATLREWLERSAGIFRRIVPGVADQPLIDAGFPSYNFDVIDGVTYTIDPTEPSRYDVDGALVAPDAHRIVDLRHGGQPIDEASTFAVVVNNYRAGGGGNFPGVDARAVILAAPDTNRDVIVRFVHGRGTVDPQADGNWRLASVPDTSVTFDAGPGARAHLGDVKGLAIEAVGPAGNGFERFRIRL
jgi:2',3'-cyclic-nucleotide 2'-phosphodiesterase/3'-nucleotidase